MISYIEELPLFICLYETASAIGTVGLSQGITPDLGIASKLILIFFMYVGRVGGLTLIFSQLAGNHDIAEHLPQEKMMVG